MFKLIILIFILMFIVSHLSKYLSTRLCVEDSNTKAANSKNSSSTTTSNDFTQYDFQIYISSSEKLPNSFQLLNQNLTLEHCIDQHWKLNNRPLELFYNYIKPSQNGTHATGIEFNNNNSNSSSSISSNSTASS